MRFYAQDRDSCVVQLQEQLHQHSLVGDGPGYQGVPIGLVVNGYVAIQIDGRLVQVAGDANRIADDLLSRTALHVYLSGVI
jgi:hypothetical protein